MPASTTGRMAPKPKAKGSLNADDGRRRVTLACTRCRYRKIKASHAVVCDGAQPSCTNCVRNPTSAGCNYKAVSFEENQAAKERKRQAKLEKEKSKTRNGDEKRNFRVQVVEALNLPPHRGVEGKPVHQGRSFSMGAASVAASRDYALPTPPGQFASHSDIESHFSVWHISQKQSAPSSSTSGPSQVSQPEDSTPSPAKCPALDSLPDVEFPPLEVALSTASGETPSVLVHDPSTHFPPSESGGAPPFAPYHSPPNFTAPEPPLPFSINPAELYLPSHAGFARRPRLSHVRSAPFLRCQSSPHDAQELHAQSSQSSYPTTAPLAPPPPFHPTAPFLPFDPTPQSQSFAAVDPSSYLLDVLVDGLFRAANHDGGEF
ncbi:hypothetical protein JCM1840_000406 [Sporobolomyces johnsonii]